MRSMYDLILKNAQIADCKFPKCELFDVAISGGKICEIEPSKNSHSTAAKSLDMGGNILCAGFIDIHFHGAANSDICDDDSDAIFKVARQKLKEGVTSILPATLTLSKDALKKTFHNLKNYAKNPESCRFLGVHLEGPFINPKIAGAQNAEFARDLDISEIDELNSIAKILKVSFSPELKGSSEFVRGLLNRGIVPSAAHTCASFGRIEELYRAGLKNVTHFGNRCGEFGAREIGVVGAGLLFGDITLEIIADKIHLSPDFIRLIFARKDASKIVLITDSMRASGLGDGVYSLGGLDVKVSGAEARLVSDSSLAGSVLKMSEALKNLCEILNADISKLAKCASLNAANSLNIPNLGEIKEGNFADFALLDTDFKVLKTIVGGVVKYEA